MTALSVASNRGSKSLFVVSYQNQCNSVLLFALNAYISIYGLIGREKKSKKVYTKNQLPDHMYYVSVIPLTKMCYPFSSSQRKVHDIMKNCE